MSLVWVTNYTNTNITVQITAKTNGDASVFTLDPKAVQTRDANGWFRKGTETATIVVGNKKKVLNVEPNDHINVYVDRVERTVSKEFLEYDK
ncbi:hypothetical protein HGRIS_003389 [Hohenbuehelia grisea]|uniref:Uncharacterized protein n=1 Tax=Hohenbuehelia grisea TaxID=104357 RepID=A0ABR3JG24_9AGAR